MEKFAIHEIWIVTAAICGVAWIVVQNLAQWAREHGLVDKAKKEITVRNVLAAIGLLAIVIYAYQYFFASPSVSPPPATSDDSDSSFHAGGTSSSSSPAPPRTTKTSGMSDALTPYRDFLCPPHDSRADCESAGCTWTNRGGGSCR